MNDSPGFGSKFVFTATLSSLEKELDLLRFASNHGGIQTAGVRFATQRRPALWLAKHAALRANQEWILDRRALGNIDMLDSAWPGF